MLINVKYKKKFIFVSNTKSASTSVEDVLDKYCHIIVKDPPSLKHMGYQEIVRNFRFLFSQQGFEIDKFYKFGIIRDPIDWIISWFNYRSRKQLANPRHLSHKNYLGNIDFDQFIELLPQDWIQPQSNLFIDKNGKNAMNFLIRYEKLEEDFAYVMEQIGLEQKLTFPHKNQSANLRIKREDISEKSCKKIKHILRQDYQFIENIFKDKVFFDLFNEANLPSKNTLKSNLSNLSNLNYGSTTSSSQTKYTYTIYANCQGRALAKLLNKDRNFAKQYKYIPIDQVQNIDPIELDRITDEVVPQVDLFIYQPVSDKYRNNYKYSSEYLISKLPNHCKHISFPSCYFKGYNPELINLKMKSQKIQMIFSKGQQKFPVLVHDINIINSFLNSETPTQAIENILNPNFYKLDFMEDNLDETLSQLKHREDRFKIDIPISNFIEKNYRTQRLFYTFSHPSFQLLQYIAQQVSKLLSIEFNYLTSDLDPLEMTIFPIYRSVENNLNLKFNNAFNYKIKENIFTLEEAVSQYFDFYSSLSQEILKINLKQNQKYLMLSIV